MIQIHVHTEWKVRCISHLSLWSWQASETILAWWHLTNNTLPLPSKTLHFMIYDLTLPPSPVIIPFWVPAHEKISCLRHGMNKINHSFHLFFYKEIRGILNAQGQITLILEWGMKARKGKSRHAPIQCGRLLLRSLQTAERGLCPSPPRVQQEVQVKSSDSECFSKE